MIVFTIGYTKKSAEQFFRCLKQPRLLRVLDVRLKNAALRQNLWVENL